MSEPIQSQLTWVFTRDQLPAVTKDVLMLFEDCWGKGYYINPERGWCFNGCSGGSPRMIAKRTPLMWAYFPQVSIPDELVSGA